MRIDQIGTDAELPRSGSETTQEPADWQRMGADRRGTYARRSGAVPLHNGR